MASGTTHSCFSCSLLEFSSPVYLLVLPHHFQHLHMCTLLHMWTSPLSYIYPFPRRSHLVPHSKCQLYIAYSHVCVSSLDVASETQLHMFYSLHMSTLMPNRHLKPNMSQSKHLVLPQITACLTNLSISVTGKSSCKPAIPQVPFSHTSHQFFSNSL